MNSPNKNKISNPNSKYILYNLAWRMNKVCDLLDALYNINCGGCCYIAYCLSKLLKEDDIEYEVVVVSDSCEDLTECEELRDIPCSCTHYGISTAGGLINIDENDLESYTYSQYFHNPHPDDVKEHYESGYWNDCYDTNENEFIWETLKRFYYDFTQDLRK